MPGNWKHALLYKMNGEHVIDSWQQVLEPIWIYYLDAASKVHGILSILRDSNSTSIG